MVPAQLISPSTHPAAVSKDLFMHSLSSTQVTSSLAPMQIKLLALQTST